MQYKYGQVRNAKEDHEGKSDSAIVNSAAMCPRSAQGHLGGSLGKDKTPPPPSLKLPRAASAHDRVMLGGNGLFSGRYCPHFDTSHRLVKPPISIKSLPSWPLGALEPTKYS